MRPTVTLPLRIRATEIGGPQPSFCIPLVAPDLKQLLTQAEVAHGLQADMIEWRADSFSELTVDSLLEAAHALRRTLNHEPILYTLRISVEGGAKELSQDLRRRCIDALLCSGTIDLIDVELCNGPEFVEPIIRNAQDNDKRVILSFHDFRSTPSNEVLLEKISSMVNRSEERRVGKECRCWGSTDHIKKKSIEVCK